MVKQCCKCKKLDFLNRNLSFHRFPKDHVKRKKWIAILGLTNYVVPKTAVVCSDHFNKDDITYNKAHYVYVLHEDAMPEINPDTEECSDSEEPRELCTQNRSSDNLPANQMGEKVKVEPVERIDEYEQEKIINSEVFDGYHIKNEEVIVKDEPEEINESSNSILHEEPDIKVEVEKVSLKVRRPKNTNIPNLFKCDQCNFQTKYKHYIKVHILRHNDPAENEIVKCPHCDYQTIYKTRFRKHLLRHKHPHEVEMFQCTQCSYKTLGKTNLKRHSLVHIDSNETVVYKCKDCDFRTIHKQSLKKHSVIHKDPSEVSVFKCTDCSFETLRKDSIKVHVQRHQKPEEMLKCAICGFQTVHKFNLKSHLRLHKKDKVWYKCTECEYQSIYKSTLKRHCLSHKGKDEITKIIKRRFIAVYP